MGRFLRESVTRHALAAAVIVGLLTVCACSSAPEVSAENWQTFQGGYLSLKLPSSFSQDENHDGAILLVSGVDVFSPGEWSPKPRLGVDIIGGWSTLSMFNSLVAKDGPSHISIGTYYEEVLLARGEVGKDGREPLVLVVRMAFNENDSVKVCVEEGARLLAQEPPWWVHVEIEVESASEDSARLRVSAPYSQVGEDEWVEYWVFTRAPENGIYCVIYRASAEAMDELGPVFLESAKTISVEGL